MENIISLLSLLLFLVSSCSFPPHFSLFPSSIILAPIPGSFAVETVSAAFHFSCNSSVRKLFNVGFDSLEQNKAICNPCVLIMVN